MHITQILITIIFLRHFHYYWGLEINPCWYLNQKYDWKVPTPVTWADRTDKELKCSNKFSLILISFSFQLHQILSFVYMYELWRRKVLMSRSCLRRGASRGAAPGPGNQGRVFKQRMLFSSSTLLCSRTDFIHY